MTSSRLKNAIVSRVKRHEQTIQELEIGLRLQFKTELEPSQALVQAVGELMRDDRLVKLPTGKLAVGLRTKGFISLAWTAPAFLKGQKTVTRRRWRRSFATSFQANDLLLAYDRLPQVGGKPIGIIRLTMNPYEEDTDRIPESDWVAEGFAYLEATGARAGGRTPRQLWERWRTHPERVWTLRFESIRIF